MSAYYYPYNQSQYSADQSRSRGVTPTTNKPAIQRGVNSMRAPGDNYWKPNYNQFSSSFKAPGKEKSRPNGANNRTYANGSLSSNQQHNNASPSQRSGWKERPHVGKYKLVKTIGKGNFAKVKLAEHMTTGMEVAVKVIDKSLLNNHSMRKLFREVRIMKTLDHPNIVKLFEVIESDRHLYLVMEYLPNGELFDYLVTNGRLQEEAARAKFRQILSAVQYCHSKMVVHRDLKAENLLLDCEHSVKIADFGFSNNYSLNKKLDTFCGSPPYAAPELFLGRAYEGPEVDVWSLGVILYTLVSGALPFDGKNLKELRECVLRGLYRIPYYMSHDCEVLLKKMLVLQPNKRSSLKEVMRDKWVNQGLPEGLMQPFVETPANYDDPERIEIMEKLGFTRQDIEESLNQQLFNNVTATYLLLGRRKPGVQYARLTFPSHQSTGSLASAQSSGGGPARKNSTPTPPASSGHNSAGSTISSIGSRASSTPRFLAAQQNNNTPSPSPLVVSGGQFTTNNSPPQASSTTPVESEAKAAAAAAATISVKYQGYKKPITTDLDVAVASKANGAPAVPLHRSVTNPAAMNRALMQQAQLANQRYHGTHQHHNDAQPLNKPHNHLPRRQPEPLFRLTTEPPKTAPLARDEEEEDGVDGDANDTLQRRPKTSPSNGNTSVSIVGGKRITHLELKPVSEQQQKTVRRRASVAATAREVVQPRAASPDSCSTSEDEGKKNGSGSVSSTSSEEDTEQNKTQDCIVPHSQSILSEGITLINSNRNSYQSDYDNPSSNQQHQYHMSNSFMSNPARSQLRNSVTYHQKPLEKATNDTSPAPLPRGGTNGLQHYGADSLHSENKALVESQPPTSQKSASPPPPQFYPNRSSNAYRSLRLPSVGAKEMPAGETYSSRVVGPVETQATTRPVSDANRLASPFLRNVPERSTLQHVPTNASANSGRLFKHPATSQLTGASAPPNSTMFTSAYANFNPYNNSNTNSSTSNSAFSHTCFIQCKHTCLSDRNLPTPFLAPLSAFNRNL